MASIGGMAGVSAGAVAAEIRRRLPGVPIKKLHKLLYYAQAHHLLAFDQPLFSESISAWDRGPVVAQLWWAEKNQASAPDGNDMVSLDEGALNTIGYVVSRYGKLSGAELERLTHSEEPWMAANAERGRRGEASQRIELATIVQYFRHEAEADEAEPPVDAHQLRTLVEGAADRETAPVQEVDSREALLARLR